MYIWLVAACTYCKHGDFLGVKFCHFYIYKPTLCLVVIFTWKCKSYCITINFFSNLYSKFNQILVVIEFAYILPVQTYQCLWYSFRKKMETKNSAIKIFKEFWFNIKFGFRNTCRWLLILYMYISCRFLRPGCVY